MYGQDILCGISNGTFEIPQNFKWYLWNSTQNILPILWKIWFLNKVEILRALRFKSSDDKGFWNTHFGHPGSYMDSDLP